MSTDQKPEHVCGLQGYNGMIDPPCPGCQARDARLSQPSPTLARVQALKAKFKALMTRSVLNGWELRACHWCQSTDLHGAIVHSKDCPGAAFLTELAAALEQPKGEIPV